MRYQFIPGTDLNASVICMGTGGCGGGMSREDAFRLFDLYLELGGNFIDTAHSYDNWLGMGRSLTETRLGEWMKERGNREKLVFATKGGHPEEETPHQARLGRDVLHQEIDESLQLLGTDYIDLYWLHRDEPSRPVEEIMETLHSQVLAGKIRHIGCSHWTVERIKKAQAYAAANGLTPFVANQPYWNLAGYYTGSETDDLEADRRYYAETGMAVIPFSSQANGFFSGRYARGQAAGAQGSSAHVERTFFNDRCFDLLDRVQQLASELGTTGTVIALAYLTSQPFLVFPIIGSKTPEYMRDSCTAGDLLLTPEQLRFLETGSSH
ncbi:aldo/keto reductase [Paenibacillus rhizovicinus]|uniref:Aldo/keto reductase n=1 Tax=Paenibacillus rhizovicinus TaxID=2704463 RepID=A0A6C0NY44_9BACL|nr:aldo/keto reductase [Paenibacillus rhizovicinus]QHW31164.1 aldo/keto reductase [Paenibacillus rhizovicinus]